MKDSKPIVVLLLTIGAAVALWLGQGERWSGVRAVYLVGAAAIWLIPPVRKWIAVRLDTMSRRPAPTIWGTLFVGAVMFAALLLVAALQGRELIPKTHDEFMYLVQTRMLSAGRLWMPAHTLGDFFDTYFVEVTPRYASVYFPGTALLYAPFARLELPYWLMPAVFGGSIAALLYRIVAELIDRAAAALVPIILLATPMYRVMMMGILSHTALMLFGLIAVLAWLRWMKTGGLIWAAMIGAAAGWAAITRPIDAICYVLPLVLLGIPRLAHLPRKNAGLSIMAAVACAAPFLAIQLIFDVGVTGHLFQTPYQQYLDRDQPGSMYGFHTVSPQARPASAIVQKQLYYDRFIKPIVERHSAGDIVAIFFRERLPLMLSATLFHPILIALSPLGLLALWDRRRLALVLALTLFILLYTFNAFMLAHYPFMYLPSMVLLALLGMREVELAWPTLRMWTAPLLVLLIVGAAAGSMPVLNPTVHDRWETPVISDVHDKLTALNGPAVVLFHFDPAGDVHEEPVYNYDAAWPDDQPIIRAHDLGPRDVEIFKYYAKRQPQRVFWLYDRSDLSLRRLGTAAELARAAASRPASP